jgi:predicted ATPase/DNA-binding NarL/FixJ family response regulator
VFSHHPRDDVRGHSSRVARNVLYPATPFVGRLRELTEIASRLNDPNCRLLTLVGPGGIGKTRLALESARQFPEAYFVPLQPLTSSDFIISALADAIGFQFYSGSDPKQQLLDYLREKSWLLVLDNFEQLLDGATLLSEILAAAGNLRLLVTSRERLNLVEEWVLDIGGLAYPLNEYEADTERYSAVELFVQQARRVKSSFSLTDANHSAVIFICRLVGGMPLGIELAASWVRVLSCEAIAEEIERSLDILETPARNVEPRHRTMRAAFAPTWERLSEDERGVFMRLSVFRGGFTHEAAEQVASASLRILSTLVDKSLLRVDANGRYDLHELLRQFAAEKLAPHEHNQAYQAHCAYYIGFLHERWEYLKGNHQKRALAEIEVEIDNVRASWHWAVMHNCGEEINQAMKSLWFFYDTRSLYPEAQQAFQIAAESAARQGTTLTLGRLLARLGGFYFSLSRPEHARSLLEESVAILREQHAHQDVAFALLRLSEVVMFSESNPTGAKVYLEETLSLCREPDDWWEAAYALRWLAFADIILEDFEKAAPRVQESLAIYLEHQDKWGTAIVLSLAGLVALGMGDFEEAMRAGRESLALCREIGLQWATVNSLLSIAGAACALGDYRESKQRFYEALKEAYERQFIGHAMWALAETAALWMAIDEPEWALEILAFSLHYRISPPFNIVTSRQRFARLEAELRADVVKTTVERGKSRNFDDIVAETLAELQIPESMPSNGSIPSQLSADLLSERERDVLRLMAAGLNNLQIADQLVRSDNGHLSKREREVAVLVAEGRSNRQIAATLVVSERTIETHVTHILSKLGFNSRTQIVAWVIHHGLKTSFD